MNEETVLTEIRCIVAEVLRVQPDDIFLHTAQGDPPEWDSIASLEIADRIEGEYGLYLTTPEVLGAVSVQSLLRLVLSKGPGGA